MRGDEDVTVTATVRVELEIESGSNWGGACTLAQVHQQAVDGAEGRLQEMVTKEKFRIVPGSVAVIAVRVLAMRKDRR